MKAPAVSISKACFTWMNREEAWWSVKTVWWRWQQTKSLLGARPPVWPPNMPERANNNQSRCPCLANAPRRSLLRPARKKRKNSPPTSNKPREGENRRERAVGALRLLAKLKGRSLQAYMYATRGSWLPLTMWQKTQWKIQRCRKQKLTTNMWLHIDAGPRRHPSVTWPSVHTTLEGLDLRSRGRAGQMDQRI